MDTKRLLLAEDNALIRSVLAEYLLDHGYEVVEAESGDDGAAKLPALTHLDLLLTDLRMPGHLDGFGLAKQARHLYPKLPIIYMSGGSDAQAKKFGEGEAFLRKPFGASEVLAIIQRMTTALV